METLIQGILLGGLYGLFALGLSLMFALQTLPTETLLFWVHSLVYPWFLMVCHQFSH
jgi:hypothetical protein